MSDIILKAISGTDTDTVTLPQSVTAGRRVMDALRGRRGKYKTATVFLVPVTDTPTMTPFCLMDCHIILLFLSHVPLPKKKNLSTSTKRSAT